MPRYRPTQPRKEYDRNEFVGLLARELAVDVNGPARQPLIYEESIDQTDTVHVVVYWDRWAEVPSEERSGMILDAYERVDRSLVPKVTFAMGVTFGEAAELNLLPWAVVPVSRRNESDPREVEAAMLEEGAIRRGRASPAVPDGRVGRQRVAAAFPHAYRRRTGPSVRRFRQWSRSRINLHDSKQHPDYAHGELAAGPGRVGGRRRADGRRRGRSARQGLGGSPGLEERDRGRDRGVPGPDPDAAHLPRPGRLRPGRPVLGGLPAVSIFTPFPRSPRWRCCRNRDWRFLVDADFSDLGRGWREEDFVRTVDELQAVG